MKLALIVWEEFPDKIVYSAGFYVRQNQREVIIASEHDGAEYVGTLSIPLNRIREKRIFSTKRGKK